MEKCSYLCPNCGGVIEYKGKQEMYCTHCGEFMTLDEVENYYRERDRQNNTGETIEGDSVQGELEVDLKNGEFIVYTCAGCGIELLANEYTTPTFCGFCGSSSLERNGITDYPAPSMIIPFKIKKEEAVARYKAWAKRGGLAPLKLNSRKTIKKITGMYVAFGLYDYHAQIQMAAKCIGNSRDRNGRYVAVDQSMAKREIEASYLKIPVGASGKISDDTMDKLGPYEYGDLVDFETAFLSGYCAEKYNYNSKLIASRSENKARQYILDAAMKTIYGYEDVTVENKNTRLECRFVTFALLPIWILNYKYKRNKYTFIMNGQTGKIVAEKPISNIKAVSWFAGISALTFMVLELIGRFLT